MKLRLIVCGKLKDPGLSALCQDYERRIRRHLDFEQVEVRDSAALLKQLTPGEWSVALEVGGHQHTSTEFARTLERWLQRKSGRVSFFIGAADGLPQELSKRADAQLSLSTMTLPHRLARVVLCEQLYRATSIWNNEPYARE